MNLAPPRTPAALRPALAPILRPDVNVVSLPRPIEPSLLLRLEALAERSRFANEARLDTESSDVGELVDSIEDEDLRAYLATDIRFLTRQLGAILGRRHLHAQLFVKRSDGCRKIHADNVSIRLLCTYAGPGTDWLPDEDLVREHLRPSRLDIDVANRRVIRPGATLRRCSPGEVLLLKGHAYPGNAGRGAAHRSPPLGSSGVARLVLKIDEHPCGC